MHECLIRCSLMKDEFIASMYGWDYYVHRYNFFALSARKLFFFFFFTHLYCLVGCLSMIVWKHVVLDVLYACVLHFVFAFVQRN